jgi:hypothetical protein
MQIDLGFMRGVGDSCTNEDLLAKAVGGNMVIGHWLYELGELLAISDVRSKAHRRHIAKLVFQLSLSTIQVPAETYLDRLVMVLEAKGDDYAHNRGRFWNFELSAALTGVSVFTTFRVRMVDKYSRVCSLLSKPPSVVEESLFDTYLDLLGYLALEDAYDTSTK